MGLSGAMIHDPRLFDVGLSRIHDPNLFGVGLSRTTIHDPNLCDVWLSRARIHHSRLCCVGLSRARFDDTSYFCVWLSKSKSKLIYLPEITFKIMKKTNMYIYLIYIYTNYNCNRLETSIKTHCVSLS